MKRLRRLFRSVFYPVERHRHIYRADWRAFILPLSSIIIFVSAIFGLSALFAIDGDDIVVSNTGAGERTSLIWAIICQFADPGNLNMASTKGSIIAFLCAFGGIFCLSGLFVSSLVSYNSRKAEKWRNGLIHYNGRYNRHVFKDYIVIIGVNEQTATIAKKSLRRPDVKYVLIQTKNEVERARFKLELKMNKTDEERIVFYFGDRTLYEDIKDLRVERAKEVYILGEDMNDKDEQDHDSFNMKCLELISQYCEKLPKDKKKRWAGKKLRCHVNFEYQSTYTIFKSTHIYKRINEDVEFLPFNIHEIWAKKVLVDNYAITPGNRADESSVQRYLPLDCYKDERTDKYVGIKSDTDKSVHLFVVGMNQMGTTLALQTALLIHLPNYHTKGCRTTISFIDEQAIREGEFIKERLTALFSLCRHRTIKSKKGERIKRWDEEKEEDIDPMFDPNSRYHHLGANFMDLQWEFIEGNIASQEILDYITETVNDERQTCTVAVCFNNPAKSIATALYLPESIMKKVLQVLVYQKNNFDLIKKVATGETEWKRFEKLRPFGMHEDCYKESMFDNIKAKLALAVYMRGSLQYRKENIDFFINYINELWSEEGIVNKLSNINLTDSFPSKLRSVGLNVYSPSEEYSKILDNADMVYLLGKTEHSRWLTERLTMGYRPLDRDEMDVFLHVRDDKERKMKKEFLKSKKRAHLDICSYEMLATLDKVQMNDHRIIRNLLRMRFYRRESEIRCRKILASDRDMNRRGIVRRAAHRFIEIVTGKTSKEWKETYEYIHDMVHLPVGKTDVGGKKVPAFWIGAYPVTQALWKEIMGLKNNPSHYKGDKRPVEMVSREDIEDFLVVLNDRTGLHFTLPSKDEWYYAALAGRPASYYSNVAVIDRLAWYNKGKQSPGTHEVCKKEKNDRGLYDMLGNVWEWSRTPADRAGDAFYFLGGSWKFSEKECDLADAGELWSRNWYNDYKSADLGFRLMLPYSFEKNMDEEKVQETEEYRIFCQILGEMIYVGEEAQGEPSVSGAAPGMSFWMADIPLTQRQWSAFMDGNPSEHKGRDLPVENVSFDDAMAFIKKINAFFRKELHTDLSDDKLFALPTVAQWVYAAKGGAKAAREIEASGGVPVEKDADVVAWHNGITKSTRAVRGKEPNEIGLFDMCGNVWEWCRDKSFGNCTRILKGGSWRSAASECRIESSCDWPQDHAGNDIGFRLVLVSREAAAVSEQLMKSWKKQQI